MTSPPPARTALVFPGQGSQFVGMGKALSESFPAAARAFAEADRVLGYALSTLCWEGPPEVLNQTLHTQPALLAHSVAALRVLEESFPGLALSCVAGHSLGEFSALVAAGALAFADALRLVEERARLMSLAGEANPGGMAAILGLEREAIIAVCREAAEATGKIVQLANDNCPGQVVISGHTQALERAMELARERGARRTIRLAVSIAAHSPLMASAAAEFTRVVQSAPIRAARVPLVANVSAQPILEPAALRDELGDQLTQPVRWTESVACMRELGATLFVELGPKDVLSGLIKRIHVGAQTLALGAPDDLARLTLL